MSQLPADLRGTDLWRRIESHYELILLPGGTVPQDPRDPTISADGQQLACAVTFRSDLYSSSTSGVVIVNVGDGETELVGADFDMVRSPRFSPTGNALAMLVDRGDIGIVADGQTRILPCAEGIGESIAWSPDGSALLAVVADPDADAAGAEGSGNVVDSDSPWLPRLLADKPVGGWRRIEVAELATGNRSVISSDGRTTWEAAWCGPEAVVAVQSDDPSEAAWSSSCLYLLDARGGPTRQAPLFVPPSGMSVGLPTGSRDGRYVAVVTATCSDRTVVAGDVTVIDRNDANSVQRLDLNSVDVTHMAFGDTNTLFVVGQRGLETVLASVDVATGRTKELWATETLTCGQRYPTIAVAECNSVALVVEGYGSPPELCVVDPAAKARGPQCAATLTHPGLATASRDGGRATPVRWTAQDGLALEGLLVQPDSPKPWPMVTFIHGGPIWAWRTRWAMGYPYSLLLARNGIAVFHPNPRGSSGRGEDFRAAVLGDLGGAERHDVLSGVDHLVDAGIADPTRLGILGGSHGGFLAALLVTQSERFKACVTYSPVTHWPTMRLTTNDIASQDRLLTPAGAPSPLDAADRVTTPTLVITGKNDLITPPSQGLAFHRAVALNGTPTNYVEYPTEGHGVRSFPAQIDFSARVLDWFERWFEGGSHPSA